MQTAPVAHRELLVASRRRSTTMVRLAAGALCLLLWILFYTVLRRIGTPSGFAAFQAMSALTFTYCILAGFFFTADSVTSERREGTLPLLFHARTTVLDVTLGKFVGLTLAPVYGFLAILPFFALPMMDGGVTLSAVSRTCLALTLTILFSLAAGFLASVLAQEDDAAYVRTALLIAAPTLAFGLGIAAVLFWCAKRAQLDPHRRRLALLLTTLVAGVWTWAFWLTRQLFIGGATEPWSAATGNPSLFWPSALHMAVCTLVYLAAAALFVNPNSGAGETSGSRRAKKRIWLSRDPAASFIHSHARGAIALVFFAAVIHLLRELYTSWLNFSSGKVGIQMASASSVLTSLFLTFSVARLAVVTFASLRQNRSFETLLCTPVGFGELVQGAKGVYWRTVCWVVLGSAIIVFFRYQAIARKFPQADASLIMAHVAQIILTVGSYWATFWLGSYFALRHRKAGTAVFLTLITAYVVPWVAGTIITMTGFWLLNSFFNTFGRGFGPTPLNFAAQIVPQIIILVLYMRQIKWAKVQLKRYDLVPALRESL